MNARRLLETLDAFARCTDTPGHGVTRFSWSPADRRARELLLKACEALDLTVRVDGIGNIRARMSGRAPGPAVLMGSHLDSVRHGGHLDGIYGVCAALETLRSFREQGHVPGCDVELVAFAEEEGSNFGSTCLGSKAVTGQCDGAALRKLKDGNGSAWERLRAFGLAPEALAEQQIRPEETRAWLEVHIEQNQKLEQSGARLGVVSAIYGMRLHRLRFTGVSDHAASPMAGRRDPMAAFARFASRMEDLWRKGTLPQDYACTVGSIACTPDVGIVIPHSVTFTVDVRHVDVPVLEAGWERIEALARSVARDYGVSMDVERLSASGGARMNAGIMAMFREAAERHNAPWMDMTSGPAHDAACMAQVTATGLLFVPSINGRSHCPQEDTAPEDLVLGAQVLEDTARRLAG